MATDYNEDLGSTMSKTAPSFGIGDRFKVRRNTSKFNLYLI